MANKVRRVGDIDLFDLLLLISITIGIIVCPFTKVEESFNMQAMHDIITHKYHIQAYDHLSFPGVVPRTFIGSLIVATFAYPINLIRIMFHLPKFYMLYICRGVLGLISWISFLWFRSGVSYSFGYRSSQLLSLIIAMTFHMPFYMSRALPNTFALIGFLWAYGLWLRDDTKGKNRVGLLALIVITPFVVIFRCDLLLLVIPWTLQLLMNKEISLIRSIVYGLTMIGISAILSLVIDKFFWQQNYPVFSSSSSSAGSTHINLIANDWKAYLWPEAYVLLFNTVENRSHEWGTQPWHWYFTNAIPKVMHIWIIFALCGWFGLQHPLYTIEEKHSPLYSSNNNSNNTFDTINTNGLYPSDSLNQLNNSIPSNYSLHSINSINSMNSLDSLTDLGSNPNLSNLKNGHASSSATNKALISIRFIELFGYMINSKNRRYLSNKLVYYSFPAIAYVILYSFLPHKELRFLLPVIFPVIAMAAAVGLDQMLRPDSEGTLLHTIFLGFLSSYNHSSYENSNQNQDEEDEDIITQRRWWTIKVAKRTSRNIFLFDLYSSFIILVLLFGSFSISNIFLSASMKNYPGGMALQQFLSTDLPNYYGNFKSLPQKISVHIDIVPAMTGITRFLEESEIKTMNYEHPIEIIYSKKEGLYDTNIKELLGFDYLITSNTSLASSKNGLCRSHPSIAPYEIVSTIEGYDRLVFNRSLPKLFHRLWNVLSMKYIRNRLFSGYSDSEKDRKNIQDKDKNNLVEIYTKPMVYVLRNTYCKTN